LLDLFIKHKKVKAVNGHVVIATFSNPFGVNFELINNGVFWQ